MPSDKESDVVSVLSNFIFFPDNMEFGFHNPVTLVQPEGNSGTTSFAFTVDRSDGSGTATFSGEVISFGSQPLADAADFASVPFLPFAFSGSMAPGELQATVMINVNGDLTPEPDEQFELELMRADDTAGIPTLITASTTSAVIQNDDGIACFARGTRVLTSAGEVAVEEIREGNLIQTRHPDAMMPVVWKGERRIDCRRHRDPSLVWPVRVRAHAFGPGRPRRDLLLSPDHAVFIDGVLIPIRLLVDGRAIAREEVDTVTYFHLELLAHSVILAEGLPVESYLEAGDRGNFANGGTCMRLYPDFSAPRPTAMDWEGRGCAPLVLVGPELKAVRRALRERADHGAHRFIQSGMDRPTDRFDRAA